MVTILTTETFDAWFSLLKDTQARVRIQVRIDRAEEGNFGDCQPVGEGVSEMRIHHGPGYRVYLTRRAWRSWCCWLAATRGPRRGISRPR